MPEGYFLFPLKGPLDYSLVLSLTRSFFQLTHFQLLSQKGVCCFTFRNVCGCKWPRSCSQDYRLIHHKCVSIDGGLLSEKMAMGNSILHHKRFTVPGFNTYATLRREQSVLGTQKQRSPNEYGGRLMVL